MKYFITSYGGVGTYLLMGLISDDKYLKIPENSPVWQEYTHHMKYPPKSFDEEVKIIYVFGNPYNTVLSHFRRRWAHNHCKNMHGDWKNLKEEWTLLEYLNNGKDLFKLEEHFDSWTNIKEKDYDVMILKYEDIPKHKEEIRRYLNIYKDIDFIKRKCDWTTENDIIRKKLEEIYGSFYDKCKNYLSIKIY